MDHRAELLCRQFAESKIALDHHEMAAAVAAGEVYRHRPCHRSARCHQARCRSMGRALDLFGQPLPYRPHSPRGTTLSVAKKDERVALIFWARTAPSQRRGVITRSGEHAGEGDLLLISWGEFAPIRHAREASNPCCTPHLVHRAACSPQGKRGDTPGIIRAFQRGAMV